MAPVFVDNSRTMWRRNIAAFMAALVVSAPTVNVPSGSLTLTGYAPTSVGQASTINVPAGALTLTGYAPRFVASINVGKGTDTTFIDAQRVQPRRSLSSHLLAIRSAPPPGTNTVNVPAGGLAITGYAPSVSISLNVGRSAFTSVIDRSPVQPRRNLSSQLLAITSAPVPGPQVNVPVGSLTLAAYAPTIAQGSQVFVGQDTQADGAETYWQPERRSYLYVLSQPGSQGFNIPTGSLTLTGFPPTFGVSGSIFVPSASLTLTGFAPTFAQANSGRVDIPLGTLTLTSYPPTFAITGPINVPTAALTLTAYPPQFFQSSAVPVGEIISVAPYDMRLVLDGYASRIVVKKGLS